MKNNYTNLSIKLSVQNSSNLQTNRLNEPGGFAVILIFDPDGFCKDGY